jgi:hypothetical protein
MSAAASSAAAAPGPSRAEQIRAKKQAAQEIADLEARMAELRASANSGPMLASTLERSLKEKLDIVHARADLSGYVGAFQEGEVNTRYTEDDLFDGSFWECGVDAPSADAYTALIQKLAVNNAAKKDAKKDAKKEELTALATE